MIDVLQDPVIKRDDTNMLYQHDHYSSFQYRGNLLFPYLATTPSKRKSPDGHLIGIKRAQQGSTQGGLEFKTDNELLSRVHHKNVLRLIIFCFDQGEQMLVYEYIVNGALKDSLSEGFGSPIFQC